MTQPVHTNTHLMRDVAAAHDDIAGQLDGARAQAEDVPPALSTWGAIMWRTKQAADELLARHDQSLLEEAAEHRTMALELRVQANGFEQTDEQNGAHLSNVVCSDDPACAD